jgi:hypothetical protein
MNGPKLLQLSPDMELVPPSPKRQKMSAEMILDEKLKTLTNANFMKWVTMLIAADGAKKDMIISLQEQLAESANIEPVADIGVLQSLESLQKTHDETLGRLKTLSEAMAKMQEMHAVALSKEQSAHDDTRTKLKIEQNKLNLIKKYMV